MFKSDLNIIMNERIKAAGYSNEDIAGRLGYTGHSLIEASEMVGKIFNNGILCLDHGRYDFKYTGEEFVREICRILEIDDETADSGIRKIKDEVVRLRERFQGYIKVIPENEVRPTGFLSAMGIHFETTIKLPVELTDEDPEIRLKKVTKICSEHFVKSNGTLKGQHGKIMSYRYFFADKEYAEVKIDDLQ
jgi:hypothetical protein